MRFFQVLVSILALVMCLSAAQAANFGNSKVKMGSGATQKQFDDVQGHLTRWFDARNFKPTVFFLAFEIEALPISPSTGNQMRFMDECPVGSEMIAAMTWRDSENGTLVKTGYAFCNTHTNSAGTIEGLTYQSNVEPDMIGYSVKVLPTTVVVEPDQGGYIFDDSSETKARIASKKHCLPEGFNAYGWKHQITTAVGPQTVLVDIDQTPNEPNCVTVKAQLTGQGFDPLFHTAKGAPSIGYRLWIYGYMNVPKHKKPTLIVPIP